MHPFVNGQNFQAPNHLNSTKPATPRRITSQITSPSTRQRQDSLSGLTLSTSDLSGWPPHQAERQPYLSVTRDPSSPNSYSLIPVNISMSRSTSQYSSTSSAQHPYRYSLDPRSLGSFDGAPPSGGSHMSRSYSSASASREGMLQPGTEHLPPQSDSRHARQSISFSSDASFRHAARNAMDLFQFEVTDTMTSESLNEARVEGGFLGPMVYNSE